MKANGSCPVFVRWKMREHSIILFLESFRTIIIGVLQRGKERTVQVGKVVSVPGLRKYCQMAVMQIVEVVMEKEQIIMLMS